MLEIEWKFLSSIERKKNDFMASGPVRFSRELSNIAFRSYEKLQFVMHALQDRTIEIDWNGYDWEQLEIEVGQGLEALFMAFIDQLLKHFNLTEVTKAYDNEKLPDGTHRN